MRSLLIAALFVAACAGSKAESRSGPMTDDPELLGACVSKPGTSAPRRCQKADDGEWRIPDEEPQGRELRQAVSLFQDGHDEPAAKLLTILIDGGKTGPCGLQVARWYRARAYFRLGHHRESFLDFGQVVRDGPENPYYDQVDEWLTKLEPFVGRETIIACLANYVWLPGAASVEGRDSHWVPYTPHDPKPEY